MRVCIVGCGAVGSLFAANLAPLDDVEVWAYDLAQRARRRDQRARAAAVRRRRGARDPLHATTRRCRAAAVRLRNRGDEGDAHRGGDRGDCARLRRRRRGVGPERGRQRGGDRARTSSRVIRGTTFPAGKLLEPGHVQWDVKGDTTFGPFEPSAGDAAEEIERARGRLHARRHAGRGGRGRPAGPVAEGDLQRLHEPDRRAHRPDARTRLRAARPARARHAGSSTRARPSPPRRGSSSTPTPRS